MGRVFHSYYTRARADGLPGRERVYSKKWCIQYVAANGQTIRKTIGLDKRIAVAALAKAEDRESRLRAGLADPVAENQEREQPLVEAVHQYLSVLESLNRTVAYRDGVKKQLGLILVSCKWHYWQDVTSDALLHYLHKLRTTPCVRPGQKVPDQGRSPATLNAYLRSAKGFCNWYADKLKTTSPLKKLKSFNEQVDRRRSRRILTDDELLKLLAATEAAPRRHKTKIKPLDRSALYRIAAYTGLRANELASLTPESFQMERIPPVVVVLAQNA